MIRAIFWLKRTFSALNIVGTWRSERREREARMLAAVSEVCAVVRSQNALAEAQTKLLTQWFESLSVDPTPGRSINYTPHDELDEFARIEGVEVGKLKTYY